MVKPKGAPKPSPRVFFLDANYAWVINEGEAGAPDTVFRTSDAGLTWQSAEVYLRLGNIVFLDPQNGWGLFTEDCGAGSCGGTLSHTTDV